LRKKGGGNRKIHIDLWEKSEVQRVLSAQRVRFGDRRRREETIMDTNSSNDHERLVHVSAGSVVLEGNLSMPHEASALVLFAHGSGSSRHSPRNRYVAGVLQEAGLATLLIDLLTALEEKLDARTAHLRFDIDLLAQRLVGATDWLRRDRQTAHLSIGYFGASTGAGAALVAAADRPEVVGAVVSRGGRPDLAKVALAQVRAPTLLIVGGEDLAVLALNRQALHQLAAAEKQLAIVPGASHLFEEPGTLEEVAHLAAQWFGKHLSGKMTTGMV
jgi:dienelactone hydrolase